MSDYALQVAATLQMIAGILASYVWTESGRSLGSDSILFEREFWRYTIIGVTGSTVLCTAIYLVATQMSRWPPRLFWNVCATALLALWWGYSITANHAQWQSRGFLLMLALSLDYFCFYLFILIGYFSSDVLVDPATPPKGDFHPSTGF